MRAGSSRHPLRAVLVMAALVLAPSLSRAGAIVAPLATQSAEGDTNNLLPFSQDAESRIQQVYASSDFSSMGGPRYIDQIAFRQDRDGSPFAVNVPDVRIALSTTGRGPGDLSTTFASNVGANESVVYQGNLAISSMPVDPNIGSNPRPFDVVINLQKPFLYDPSQGNLLLDITSSKALVVSAWNPSNPVLLDASSGNPDTSRVYSYSGLGALHPGTVVDQQHGVADGIGLATQFLTGGADPLPQPGVPTTVPEPGTLAFYVAAVVGLLASRRRGGGDSRP